MTSISAIAVPSSFPSSTLPTPARKISYPRLRSLGAEEDLQWGDQIRRRPEKALSLLRDVIQRPDRHRVLDLGRQLHAFLLRNDAGRPLRIQTSLLDLYGKCGLLRYAHHMFDRLPERDVVSWTAMINADASASEAIFFQMLCSGVVPNAHTLTTVLRRANFSLAHQIHSLAVKRNLHVNPFVGNALVAMYAEHGALDLAERVFHGIRDKDAACFNGLLASLGSAVRVVAVFGDMGLAGVEANQGTFISLLSACSELAVSSLVRQLHAQVLKTGLLSDEMIPSALLNAYAKSGDLDAAVSVFRELRGGDTAASLAVYNSMINAYGKHGVGTHALQLFDEMLREKMEPDHITFTCLLSACGHKGMVEEGERLWEMMKEKYGVLVREEHYGCMADLLGRAGRTKEAMEMAEMGGVGAWGAVLGWCREWGCVEGGEEAARRVLEMEPEGGAAYVGLAGVYAGRGRWRDAAAVRRRMERKGVKKTAGRSWIEDGRVVCGFRAGERERGYPKCRSGVWKTEREGW